jgi:hypothetical protein
MEIPAVSTVIQGNARLPVWPNNSSQHIGAEFRRKLVVQVSNKNQQHKLATQVTVVEKVSSTKVNEAAQVHKLASKQHNLASEVSSTS